MDLPTPSLIEAALAVGGTYLMHLVKKRETEIDKLREGHAAQETRLAVVETTVHGVKGELLLQLTSVKETVALLREDLRRHMEGERETIADALRGVLAERRGPT